MNIDTLLHVWIFQCEWNEQYSLDRKIQSNVWIIRIFLSALVPISACVRCWWGALPPLLHKSSIVTTAGILSSCCCFMLFLSSVLSYCFVQFTLASSWFTFSSLSFFHSHLLFCFQLLFFMPSGFFCRLCVWRNKNSTHILTDEQKNVVHKMRRAAVWLFFESLNITSASCSISLGRGNVQLSILNIQITNAC